MNRLDRLQRLFRYDDWANRETLASIGEAGRSAGSKLGSDAAAPPTKSVKVFAHVVGAERLWLDRLQRKPPSLAVWPEFSLARCRDDVVELGRVWDDFLGDLDSADLDREIGYVNSKGERWSSRVEDVLVHVVLHSAYHRGQIAAELRAAGAEPAYTDFIHAVRSGFVDEP